MSLYFVSTQGCEPSLQKAEGQCVQVVLNEIQRLRVLFFIVLMVLSVRLTCLLFRVRQIACRFQYVRRRTLNIHSVNRHK